MMIWQSRSSSVNQTMSLGREIAAMSRAGDIIALIGELGAGKTQLVRGLAEGLGISPSKVASPTFVLVHEYEPPFDGPMLVHVDAYRMKTAAELETIGWGDEFREGAVVVVEWADRIPDALGDDRLEIELSHLGDEHRLVTCRAFGNWRNRAPQPMEDFGQPTKCPTCGGMAMPSVDDYPFCSHRCRLADLNRWFNEDYKISRPIEQADLDEG